MLIDCYVPNRLKTLLDGMVNQYISETEEQLKPNQLKKLKDGMACLVYNISHCVSTGENEFVLTLNTNDFSKPIIYNGVTVKRKVSCLWFKRCLYWMVDREWVSLSVGSVESFKHVGGRVVPDQVSSSLVAVSEELREVFKPVSSAKHIEISKNVLELRDEDGNNLPFRLTDSNYRLIELLDTYNQYLLDTTISIGHSKYVIQGKKVFNDGSWDLGGRTYLCGVKVMSELLKRENRGKIMIDGEETVELDWSRCHLGILADLEGHKYGDGFDPYSLKIDGYDSKCLRSIAKTGILCLINARSKRSAMMATTQEITKKLPLKDWKSCGKIPKKVEVSKILNMVEERNSYAKKYFGCGYGGTLMNIESRMMDIVLKYFTDSGKVIIPIHDGGVCRFSDSGGLYDIMGAAYREVIGNKSNNCKVEIKHG